MSRVESSNSRGFAARFEVEDKIVNRMRGPIQMRNFSRNRREDQMRIGCWHIAIILRDWGRAVGYTIYKNNFEDDSACIRF